MLTKNIKKLKTMDQPYLEIGCFRTQAIAEKFGIPIMVLSIAQYIDDNLHAQLPEDDGREFFAEFAEAIGQDGKDLSLVPWKFLHSELKAMPEQKPDIQSVIDLVIKGIGLLAEGKEWNVADAGEAAGVTTFTAADAAYSAYAANAAYSAAYAAIAYPSDAESAAYSEAAAAVEAMAHTAAAGGDLPLAYTRQRKTLLSLIAKA